MIDRLIIIELLMIYPFSRLRSRKINKYMYIYSAGQKFKATFLIDYCIIDSK